MKNLKHKLKDQEYGEETEKRGEWDTNSIGSEYGEKH